MSAPVHFEVGVLYCTTVGPACGFDAQGELTNDPAKVTCRECCALCGLEQLTECRGDPLLKLRVA